MPVWGKGKGQRVGHQKIDEHLGFKFLFLCVCVCQFLCMGHQQTQSGSSDGQQIVAPGSQACWYMYLCFQSYIGVFVYLCMGHQRIDANPLWWVVHSNSGQSTLGDHSGKIWGILVARGGSAMLVLRSESPILPDYTID